VILTFEEPETMGPLSSTRGLKVERVREHATDGEYALKVVFYAYDPKKRMWPAVSQPFDPPVDWTGFAGAEVDVFNPQAEEAEIGISYPGWYDYFMVPPQGTRTIEVSLRAAAEVKSLNFLMRLRTTESKTPTTFFIDSFRLLPKSVDDADAVECFFRRPVSLGRLPLSVPADKIRAVMRVDGAPEELSGLSARVRLNELVRTAPLQGGEAVCEFPPPQEETQATFELVDASGKSRYSETQTIRPVPPGPGQAGFDEHGLCYVDGKPFFPISIFNPAPQEMPIYKKMGFNCVGPYKFADEEWVAAVKAHGLKLISNSAPDARVRAETGPEAQRVISAAIRGIKDHSVVLGYYMYDEPKPDRQPVAAMLGQTRAAAGADPGRVVIGLNNSHYFEYAPCADVMIVDAYGFPERSFDIIISRLGTALAAMAGRGPVWLTPQCFGWMAYCLGEQQPTEQYGRPPNYDELRSSQWLGVAMGAQGIVWYSAAVQSARNQYQYPLAWQGLAAATQELAALHDVIVRPRVVVTSSDAQVYAAGRDLGDGLFAVVVNTSDEVKAPTISGVKAARLLRLDGQGSVEVVDRAFSDSIPPRTTQLYSSRDLGLALPDVSAVRQRLSAAQAAFLERTATDVARYEQGARMATSWGLPEEGKAFAWRRTIDGRRAAPWRVGDPGFFLRKRGVRWSAGKVNRGARWVEVRLPESTPIARIAVFSQNAQFRLLAGAGAESGELPSGRRTPREGLNAAPVDVTELTLSPPRQMDRLRLEFTRDTVPGQPELLFEIEMHRPREAAE